MKICCYEKFITSLGAADTSTVCDMYRVPGCSCHCQGFAWDPIPALTGAL